MKSLTSIIAGMLFTGAALAAPATHFAGCKDSDYVVLTTGSKIITQGISYSPKCAKIVRGSAISIVANQTHPLQGNNPALGTPGNPIFDVQGPHVNTAEFTFPDSGEFGYNCTVHGTSRGTGMAGSILVIEAAH